jgi:hypothetical protein
MNPTVDILDKFGPEWQDKTAELKAWKEKSDKLEELANACNNVKIKPGSPDCIAKFLKKEVGSSNVNIAMSAVKAATGLSKGMRKDFAAGIKELFNPICLKFKEKKPILHEEVHKFLDSSISCCNLEELAPEFIPLITHVAPGVKTNIYKWLEKTAQVTYIDIL